MDVLLFSKSKTSSYKLSGLHRREHENKNREFKDQRRLKANYTIW